MPHHQSRATTPPGTPDRDCRHVPPSRAVAPENRDPVGAQRKQRARLQGFHGNAQRRSPPSRVCRVRECL